MNEAWSSRLDPTLRCMGKAKRCMDYLSNWSLPAFGDIQTEIKKCPKRLKQITDQGARPVLFQEISDWSKKEVL